MEETSSQIIKWALRYCPNLDMMIETYNTALTTEDGKQIYGIPLKNKSYLYGIVTDHFYGATILYGKCSKQVEDVLNMFFKKVDLDHAEYKCWKI